MEKTGKKNGEVGRGEWSKPKQHGESVLIVM